MTSEDKFSIYLTEEVEELTQNHQKFQIDFTSFMTL